MDKILSYITFNDILLSMVIGYFLTWFTSSIISIYKAVFKRTKELEYKPKDFKEVLERCYAIFPNEEISFRGERYKRGMIVRVTTVAKKTFEGEFIGTNNDNILCVITKNFIAADIIDNISEIIKIDDIVVRG